MAQPRLFPEIESPDFIRDEAIAAVGKTVLLTHGKVGGPLFDVARAIRDDEVYVLWLRNAKPFDELNEELDHDTAGKCIKAPGVWHDVTGFDVAIWIRGYWWDKWDARTREAALLHELSHVEIKRTKDGLAKVAIRKHDVEDFVAVAKAYGPIFGDAASYVRAATVRPAAQQLAHELVDAIVADPDERARDHRIIDENAAADSDDVTTTVTSQGRSVTLDAAAIERLRKLGKDVESRVTPEPCPFHGCILAAEHAGDHVFDEAGA